MSLTGMGSSLSGFVGRVLNKQSATHSKSIATAEMVNNETFVVQLFRYKRCHTATGGSMRLKEPLSPQLPTTPPTRGPLWNQSAW